MISKETTNLISINNNGIILNPKSNSNRQIPFADVAKIHL
jgi:filamentous hemagglutinin family protein